MACKHCESERIACVNAKCSDLGYFECEHLNIDHDGYLPYIPNVCGGDYAEVEFCLECGMIQGDFPISDETVKNAVDPDDDEDDDDWDDDDEENAPVNTPPPKIEVVLLPDYATIELQSLGALFSLPEAHSLKKEPHFKTWVTSVDPINGRIMAAAFIREDEISFTELAYVPDGYNLYQEVDWNDFTRFKREK